MTLGMTIARRTVLAGALGLAAPARAAAQEPVDLCLVLAADASGSIDTEEFRLQREGYAAAFLDERLIAALTDGPAGATAVSFVEWGSPGTPATVMPWTRIDGRESAGLLAGALALAPRSVQSFNAIGDAIAHAHALIDTCPFASGRAVIDVSGDGPDLRSHLPAPVARDRAVAAGITINALAIGLRPVGGLPLEEVYRRDVIGGPGAFVMTAESRAAFASAIYGKLIREVAAASPRQDGGQERNTPPS
jgi:hypothetical protein